MIGVNRVNLPYFFIMNIYDSKKNKLNYEVIVSLNCIEYKVLGDYFKPFPMFTEDEINERFKILDFTINTCIYESKKKITNMLLEIKEINNIFYMRSLDYWFTEDKKY